MILLIAPPAVSADARMTSVVKESPEILRKVKSGSLFTSKKVIQSAKIDAVAKAKPAIKPCAMFRPMRKKAMDSPAMLIK